VIYLCEVFVNDDVYVKKNIEISHKSNGQQPITNRERPMTKTQLLRKVERLFNIPDKVFYWTILLGASYFIIRTIVG